MTNSSNPDLRLRLFPRPSERLTVVGGSGKWIETLEFGRLLDFEAGCWAATFGHSQELLKAVLEEWPDMPLHTHQFFDHEYVSKLIEAIRRTGLLKDTYHGTLVSSGTEAVSLSVMLCEVLTGRTKKLSLSTAYLGSSPDLRMPRAESHWTDFGVKPCLECHAHKNCKDCELPSQMDFESYAAFVFEPGNSGGMVVFPPDKLIQFLSESVRNSGGFVVANEVTTGVCRTGKFYGYQHYEYFNEHEPDFIAMGKMIGGGYPVSVTLVQSKHVEKLENSGFKYVQSHIDDPMGARIALKIVEKIEQENYCKQSEVIGAWFRDRINNSKVLGPAVLEVRGRGLMNVVCFKPAVSVEYLKDELLKKGFFIGYSTALNFIRLYPPLNVEKMDLESFVLGLESAVEEMAVLS